MTDKPVNVFLDTDIGPDCDDTAALAILLRLCQEGRSRLLGVTHCTGSPYGLATIDAICRYFGVSVPLGTCPDRGFLSSEEATRYTRPISQTFEHGFAPDALQPDATQTLIRALERAPQEGVTFVAIGPLNNVARYLADPQAGPLMLSRVRRMVLMAGCFEGEKDFTEWNVAMDIPAARSVIERWPGELYLCPFEAAAQVLTGACLTGTRNPVETAYRIFTQGAMLRPSWDLATVAVAVLDAQPPFEWSAAGDITIDAAGVTRFAPRADGKARYLRLNAAPEAGARLLEDLLGRAVATMNQNAKRY